MFQAATAILTIVVPTVTAFILTSSCVCDPVVAVAVAGVVAGGIWKAMD